MSDRVLEVNNLSVVYKDSTVFGKRREQLAFWIGCVRFLLRLLLRALA